MESSGDFRFMVMEVYSENPDDIMKYYHSGADMPFNFGFISVNQSCGGDCFAAIVENWLSEMPQNRWPNFVVGNLCTLHWKLIVVRINLRLWFCAFYTPTWLSFTAQLSNHDQRRITTRKGALYAAALNTVLLLLPGTPTTYMGEEIGQLDGPRLSAEETQDPWGARLGEVSLLKLAVLNNTEKCYHT